MNEFNSPDKAAPGAGTSLWLQIIVAGFILLATAFHLRLAAKGMSNYRDQHVGTALEYAKGKIDLLRPVIVGFDATDTPIALEVPIWQASAAVLFKCFGPWLGWANLTSILFIVAALWPLFQLTKPVLGNRGAWWTLVFFSAQPLVFWEGGLGSTDGSCMTFILWFLFFAEKLVRTGEMRWFFPAVLSGILSATTKAPFFFCAGLASFFLLLFQFRKSLRRWILLSSVGLSVIIVFMFWTHYTDSLLARAEFPFVDLRMSGAATKGMTIFYWYFGDLAYRLNPGVWAKAGWRFFNGEFGSFALFGLAVAGFFSLGSGLVRYWFSASAVTVLVFTHLILHHEHYYLMISPVVAITCAAALCRLENCLDGKWPKLAPWIPSGMALLLLLALVQGLTGMKIVLDMDPYTKQNVRAIQEHTAPTDKLLIEGGGWGGEELFLSNRKGLTIWDTQIVEDSRNLNRLRELGYTKLVMISESPLLNALQRVNPGGASLSRGSYREHLTPIAEQWPTLLETEDILIKQIPPQ